MHVTVIEEYLVYIFVFPQIINIHILIIPYII